MPATTLPATMHPVDKETESGLKTNRSIQRCLAVLQAFRKNGRPTLAELARITGLPHATVLRFLKTLAEDGYVVRNDSRWQLTGKVLEIGFAALESLGVSGVVQSSLQRYADALAGTCNVCERISGNAVVIARALAPEERRRMTVFNFHVGSVLPTDSALAQALSLPPGEWAHRVYPETEQCSIAVRVPTQGPRQLALGVSIPLAAGASLPAREALAADLHQEAVRLGLLMDLGPGL